MELDIRAEPKIKGDSLVVKSSINLYKSVPFGRLTLEECEDLFRQRIEALSIIEKADLHGEKAALLANAFRGIKSYIYKTNCIINNAKDEQQRKQDQYSHMLVRMYCIHHSNLWDWFKTCERKLLNYRLMDHMASLSGRQLEMILRTFDFNFERVTATEINQLCKERLVGWSKRDIYDRENLDIFKVKFTDALRFIARRSVSLKAGYALMTRYEMISVVCDAFERHLDNELKWARQHLNVGLFQTQQLLECLDAVYLEHQERIDEENRRAKRNQNGIARNPHTIDINDLELNVKNHYPPCMRYMHEALMKDSHLKHQARLCYGTFLRSGGVDMDSAIEFWRREFTKKIANDKFDRDYKYNIRHLYGREGHKKALSCFSCDKIINDNAPGPSEKHGCPFKHFDDTHLRGMLIDHGLKSVDIESIMTVRSNKEYKEACTAYFKYSRGHEPSETIKNPIHFYYESQRLANRPPKDQKHEEAMFDDDMDGHMIEAAESVKMVDTPE